MSQENVWNLQIGFVGSGEQAGRATEIIVAARKRGMPVYGERGRGGTSLTGRWRLGPLRWLL